MGWFFGFKLHLVINHKGALVAYCFKKTEYQIQTQQMSGLLSIIRVRKGVAVCCVAH